MKKVLLLFSFFISIIVSAQVDGRQQSFKEMITVFTEHEHLEVFAYILYDNKFPTDPEVLSKDGKFYTERFYLPYDESVLLTRFSNSRGVKLKQVTFIHKIDLYGYIRTLLNNEAIYLKSKDCWYSKSGELVFKYFINRRASMAVLTIERVSNF